MNKESSPLENFLKVTQHYIFFKIMHTDNMGVKLFFSSIRFITLKLIRFHGLSFQPDL